MSVYVVALDETQSLEGHFTLGGWLAPEEDWKMYFEPAWDERVLAGPPRIPYLHQTDMRNEEWRYEHNLSGDEAFQRVDEAVRVIDSMGSLYPITASMHAKDFRDHFGDRLKKVGGFGEIVAEPDYLSYIAFVPSVLHWTGTFIPDATRVNFLAERSEKTTKVMKLFHESLRQALLPRIDSLICLGTSILRARNRSRCKLLTCSAGSTNVQTLVGFIAWTPGGCSE